MSGFFWVAKKGVRDFLGYAKKTGDFFGQTNSEVVIFLGIKYEPLSDPPIIKICEWGPWAPCTSVLLATLTEQLLH